MYADEKAGSVLQMP